MNSEGWPPLGGWGVCRASVRAAAMRNEAAARRLSSLPGEGSRR